MRQEYSIRRRLSVFALIVVATAMVLMWVGLTLLFERHVERREGQELSAHLDQIIGDLRFDPDGGVHLSRELTDPRFGKIFGGLYFQVMTPEGEVMLKSRSLWDTELTVPLDEMQPGILDIYETPGPNNSYLLLYETRIDFSDNGRLRPFFVIVAIDQTVIMALRDEFSADLVPALTALATVLLLGFAAQIHIGIRPLDKLRQGVANVRSGTTKRLQVAPTTEITPLIDEVNSLLDLQDEMMTRARDRAADLAHGLKTPLTALSTDITRLRSMGATDIADDIQELSTRMQRHLDRELALARDRHGRADQRTGAKTAIDSIIRILTKTPAGERLNYQCTVPASVVLAIDQGDFMEIVGNLLENATKFAINTVTVEFERQGTWAAIIVNDDGPGVTESEIAHVAKRGVRLDTSGPGSGLGLAIVKDILTAYRGQLVLENRPGGGLSATAKIPLAGTVAR